MPRPRVTILVPDDVLFDIRGCARYALDQVAGEEKSGKALADELAGLEKQEGEIVAQIERAKANAIASSGGVAKLMEVETRQRVVRERIEQLRRMIGNRREQNLGFAADTLRSIVRLWMDRLPPLLLAQNRDFIHDDTYFLRTTIQFVDAWKYLGNVRDFAAMLPVTPATPSNVRRLLDYLERAERGQAHLGFDLPASAEQGAAEATVETTEAAV